MLKHTKLATFFGYFCMLILLFHVLEFSLQYRNLGNYIWKEKRVFFLSCSGFVSEISKSMIRNVSKGSKDVH